MEKIMGLIIGGALALLVLLSLTPTLADQYGTAQQALTDHPAAAAGLTITFLVFFLGVAMAIYKAFV